MKKILIIFLLFVSFFVISCKEIEEPNKNDDTVNTTDKEPNTNLGGDNDPNINTPEIKVIEDFTVDSEISLYLDEEKELTIDYDKDIDVEFSYTIDNDNITINENTIKGVKPGISIITVKEERSNISKDITINILLKKNKTIDFYNGYYVYKECVFKQNNGQNIYQVDEIYADNIYIVLDDEVELKEVLAISGYDKMYDLYVDGVYQEKSILIKDGNLYGALTAQGLSIEHISYEKYDVSLGDYQAYLIFDTSYSYKELDKIESTINQDLNVSNGTYAYSNVVYRSDYYKERLLVNNAGSLALLVSDKYVYKKYSESIDEDIERESLSSEIDKVISEVDPKYGFNGFTSDAIFDIYYGNEKLTNKLIVINGNLYLLEMVKNAKTGKVMIHKIDELVYIPICNSEKEEGEYVDTKDLIGKYQYKELLYGEVGIELANSIALVVDSDTLIQECSSGNVNFNGYVTNNSKVYEIVDNDSYIKTYLIVNDDVAYYAKAYKYSYVFSKENAHTVVTEIWKVEKTNKNASQEMNNNLNILCGFYYGYECVSTNYSSYTMDGWNGGKVYEETIEISSTTTLESAKLSDLFMNYTLEQAMGNERESRHMGNIDFQETVYKVKDIGQTKTQYLVSDTNGNLYLLTVLLSDEGNMSGDIIKLKRVEK